MKKGQKYSFYFQGNHIDIAGFIQKVPFKVTVQPPQTATSRSLQCLLFVVPEESLYIDFCLNLSTTAMVHPDLEMGGGGEGGRSPQKNFTAPFGLEIREGGPPLDPPLNSHFVLSPRWPL